LGGSFRLNLSWSASRGKEFARCPRENWFGRYASWGWWKERPRGEKFEVLMHKQLTSLPAFTGLCVHEAIELWFELRRGGETLSGDELYEEARERFREGWRASTGGLWRDDPRKCAHLIEHHYDEDLSEERTGKARERLEAASRFFTDSPLLKTARDAHPDTWLALESLDSFPFSGVDVYAVPDFVHREGDEVHIWDWKTGRPREADRFQLSVYALFAMHKWGTQPEAIRLHAAYLGEGSVESREVSSDELEETSENIAASLAPMQDGHYDPDEEEVDLSKFPPSGAPKECPGCRFRGICPEAVL